jgi:hypothetical protein
MTTYNNLPPGRPNERDHVASLDSVPSWNVVPRGCETDPNRVTALSDAGRDLGPDCRAYCSIWLD